MRIPIVSVSADISATLRRGHPWVYRNHILSLRDGSPPPHFPSGTWVRVLCGTYEGIGLWEAEGAIAVRIYSTQHIPDARWIATRVREAWQLRAPLRSAKESTTAYRWIYGESDGLPGVIVDMYGEYAIIRLYAPGCQVLVPQLVDALTATTKLRGIALRSSASSDRDEGASSIRTLWGRLPPDDLVIEENGLRFYANLAEGQKTGLFLDQRDNRKAMEPWCAGRRVLDCFSYVGAFGLYALRGGAQSLAFLDVSEGAMRQAKRNVALNDYPAENQEYLVADSFAWLEECARQGRRFDMVICDPPSLARDKSSRHAAIRAYTRLNRLALRCLEMGGTLVSSSCTSQVSPEMFRDALGEAAAQARVRLTLLHEAGQPLDHPVAAHLPEARYLKFVIGRAMAVS
jgi:23S rRNA (cytosine1962-C5)-methyltransferase